MAKDLQQFLTLLEQRGQLRRITAPVSPELEIAEIANRLLLGGGPALLFENVQGATMPLAINVLGTVERVCWAIGMDHPAELETLGEKLALLYQPRPPKQFSQAVDLGKALFDVVKAKPCATFCPPASRWCSKTTRSISTRFLCCGSTPVTPTG
jgi:4-hydroxy-3-polyprenylbenzoate decarboxylase